MSILIGLPIFFFGGRLYIKAFMQKPNDKNYSETLGYEGIFISMLGAIISIYSFYPAA